MRRIRTDPDLSQESIFLYYAPVYIFACLFGACALSLRLGIMPNPRGRSHAELALAGGVLVLAIFVLLVLLRVVIWGIAFAVDVFVKTDWKATAEKRSTEWHSRSVLFGGAFS